jgi:hypothetical protein
MEKEHGKNNAQSLFGVHLIPSANQLRNLLDPVPAETLSPIYREVFSIFHLVRPASIICLIFFPFNT